MSVDKAEIRLGERAVLTATVDQPVEATGGTLSIWDTTSNAQLAICTTGTTCTQSVTFSTGGPRTYEARVNSLVSNAVTVSRAAWSVILTASTTSPQAGQRVKLTATPNQDITASDHAVYIVDETTGTSLGHCSRSQYFSATWNGESCSLATNFDIGPAHTYRAYIAAGYSAASGAADMQATSNAVSVERAAWAVTLTADRTVFEAGQRVKLTATPNQDITASNYAVYIVDETTGTSLGHCSRSQYRDVER